LSKLYEIGERYRNLEALLEDENMDKEVIAEALGGVEEEFAQKALNVARFIKNLEANVKVLKEEKDRLTKREAAEKRKAEQLKEYLLWEMTTTNLDVIQDPILPISLRQCPPSVEIDPEAKIPKKYLIAQTPTVNKKELLEALKRGGKFKGVRLVDDRKYLKIG